MNRSATRALGRRLGENILRLREHRGYRRLADLAERARISKAYLSQVIGGDRLPSMGVLLAIAEALDAEVRELLA